MNGLWARRSVFAAWVLAAGLCTLPAGAHALRRLLAGEPGAYRDAVLLNAAGALIEKSVGTLPGAVTDKLPSDPETLVKINAALQVGAGALLAVGKALIDVIGPALAPLLD